LTGSLRATTIRSMRRWTHPRRAAAQDVVRSTGDIPVTRTTSATDARPADGDRERAVERLRGAYLDGALSTTTFELRVASAYGSRSGSELAGLLADLPSRLTRLQTTLRARLADVRAALGAPAADGAARAAADGAAHAAAVEVALPPRPGERLTIGRSSRCDIVVDDVAVSRLHLEIVYAAGRWQAWDLGSTNGTFLDGRRIATTDVEDGDVLTLGTTAIRLLRD
jgi:hypothetical protein